jgi:porin
MALDDDFMTSDYSSLFINAGFGPIPTQSGNVAAPIWPIGGLGAHAHMNLSETSSLQLGAYDGDAGSFTSNDDGLNNSLDGDDGYMLMLEYARVTEKFGGRTTWKLGGYHHTGKQFTHQQSGANEEDLDSLYLVIDHAASDKFGLWARLSASLDKEISTVTTHLDSGVVFTGPLQRRPDDQLGVGFLRTKFGDEYLSATNNASDSECVLELTYHAPISENFHFQPDLQWIFDAHESQDDVFVLGLRFGIDY